MAARPKCSQCMLVFSITKLPRKLPSCDHNICEGCLRQIIENQQEIIICGLCSATVKKEEIRIFPLNTNILLSLTEAPIEEQPAFTEQENGLLLNDVVPTGLVQKEEGSQDLCSLHKVVLDIVCISDRQRICPHCALFGNHREHRFKRLQDFEKEVEQKKKVFREIKNEKQKVFQGEGFCVRQVVRGTVELKKAELGREVEEQFRRYEEELRQRKEGAFREIEEFLVGFEEHLRSGVGMARFEKAKGKLEQWEGACEERLGQLDRAKRVEERLGWYYDGPLEIVSEGYIFMEELERQRQEALRRAGEALQEVRVAFEEKTQWFQSCVRVGRGTFSPRTSALSLTEVGDCEVNPFLDCTSSEIVVAQTSFFNTNTSLEVEIPSVPTSLRFIEHPNISQRTPVRKEVDTKHVRSIDKERPRLQTNVSATQIKKPVQMYSPKMSTYPSKRPISELSSFKSPSKIGKMNVTRDVVIEHQARNMEAKQPQKLYLQFSRNSLSDVFDISDCNLASEKVIEYVHRARRIHKIRGLKLCSNKLTTAGFEKLTEFMQGVSNINVANNQITEAVFEVILKYRDRLESLKVINLTHNPITLDKKAASRLQEVKKLNIVVNL